MQVKILQETMSLDDVCIYDMLFKKNYMSFNIKTKQLLHTFKV